MKSDIKDVLSKIPEFSEFIALADNIRELSHKRLLLEKKIKDVEAHIFREAVSNDFYHINGKAPAVSYIESAYKQAGFEGELLKPREELAKVTADLEHAKLTLDVYKMMLEVWRTLSANERGITS